MGPEDQHEQPFDKEDRHYPLDTKKDRMTDSKSRDRCTFIKGRLDMQFLRFTTITAILVVAAIAQNKTGSTVSVSEIPPEAIPAGTCTQSSSGYLGIVEKDKKERTKLTDQEIGEYVRKRLAGGYSITLYPQASGKMFTFETCHPAKP